MPSSIKKMLLVGVFAAVAVFATAGVAFAAPTIPVGYGWADGPHGSNPGYCLNCHSGFAAKAPAITAGVKPAHGDRGATCTQCHVVNTPNPVPAGPKPTIAFAKNTGPIAYDIKSRLTSTFSTQVDVTGANYVLTVATASGAKTVMTGKTGAANTVTTLPAWNGMIGGKRLPSASYTWTLAVTTSGGTTTTSGKISVSSIWFQVKGASAAGAKVTGTGYMKPGTANIYMSAKSTVPTDKLTLRVYRTGVFSFPTFSYNVGTAAISSTSYLRSPSVVPSPGISSFDLVGATNVSYTFTVIQ